MLQLCLLEAAELEAWEMAWGIGVLAVKAREPEFKSSVPTQKLGFTAHACNSSGRRREDPETCLNK